MTKLEQQIEDMKTKLAEMEAEVKKSKKFRWDYKRNATYQLGEYSISSDCYGNSNYYLEHGRYRKTQANAELALKRNKEANLIEALAEQFGSDGSGGCIITLDKGKYCYCYSTVTIGTPRMTEEIANKVCEVLNSKQVIL